MFKGSIVALVTPFRDGEVDDKSYQGVNLFTMGPKSVNNDELLGLYLDVVPRKSRL